MNALIVVDVQNDFLSGGALAVHEGERIVPIINRLMPHFPVVVATQDWHPRDHESFASQHERHAVGDNIELHGLPQILWPDHCVQGGSGASFASELDVQRFDHVTRKGCDRHLDSYSGFFDNGHQNATSLLPYLRERDVTEVAVVGLATDYCVKFTALDAIAAGLKTTVIADATRAVNIEPGDYLAALDEIRSAGGAIVDSDKVLH